MKHIFLIGAMMLVFSFAIQNVYAQLEVESTNNVKITKSVSIGTSADAYSLLNIAKTAANSGSWYGVKSILKTRNITPAGGIISLYGFADASTTTSSEIVIPYIVGVCGKAHTTSYTNNRFSAGVAGVATYYGGVGIYGGINSSGTLSLPSSSAGSYAGYFSGSVKVTGTLTASSVTTTSDMRLKENIQDLNQSAVGNIQLLRPVEYKLKPDSIQHVYQDDAFEMKVNHYGLLAQEVQEIFPNIVYEGGDGYLSINYTELIPVLIKSVQDLSAEVSELKAQVKELQTKK